MHGVDVCVECKVWSEDSGGVGAPPYSVDANQGISSANAVTIGTNIFK